MRITTDKGISVGGRRGRILRIRFGKGAGYINPDARFFRRGYTAWVGFNVFGGNWKDSNYDSRRFSFGFTGNANRVPWVRH